MLFAAEQGGRFQRPGSERIQAFVILARRFRKPPVQIGRDPQHEFSRVRFLGRLTDFLAVGQIRFNGILELLAQFID